MRQVGAIAVLLRRFRVERGVTLALFALVALTSLVVAVSPRLFDRVADEGLRYEIQRGTAIGRNLQFTSVDQIRADPVDPTGLITARGEARLERLPPSVRDIVATSDAVVESPRFSLVDPPIYTTHVTMRYQDGVADRLAFVDGRAPEARPPATDPTAPPRFEIALSSDTAATVQVELGDVLAASVDPGDPMIRTFFPQPSADVELEVVGLFDVTDPADPAWFDDPAYDQAAIGGTADAPIAFATALFAPAAYDAVMALGLPARYELALPRRRRTSRRGPPGDAGPGPPAARHRVRHEPRRVRERRLPVRPARRHRALPGPASRQRGGPVGRRHRPARGRRRCARARRHRHHPPPPGGPRPVARQGCLVRSAARGPALGGRPHHGAGGGCRPARCTDGGAGAVRPGLDDRRGPRGGRRDGPPGARDMAPHAAGTPRCGARRRPGPALRPAQARARGDGRRGSPSSPRGCCASVGWAPSAAAGPAISTRSSPPRPC